MFFGNSRFRSSAWINTLLVGGGSDWSVITTINLNPRQDNGRINHSPVSAMAPIMRLQFGCTYTIRIPVADSDGDVVRCRWAAKNPTDECGGVCLAFTGAVLDQSKCELQYTANRTNGWYAVAVQIEDFMPSDTTFQRPLSSIPLQFLVNINNTGIGCPAPAVSAQFLIPPTPADQSVFDVVVGNAFQFQVVAQSASSASR